MKVKMMRVLMIVCLLSILTLFTHPNQNKEILDPNLNNIIFDALPPGLEMSRPIEYYGTYEKVQKNGTIYDYINGGGEVYIKHGFQAVIHTVIKDKYKNRFTLDIFHMGTPAQTQAAFNDTAICPGKFSTILIGTSTAKLYHFEPDLFIYFIKGPYLVYLASDNDKLREPLLQFATQLYQSIN